MTAAYDPSGPSVHDAPVKWGKVIDNERCIACHACTIACKQEHLVPLGVTRTYVKQVEVGAFPQVRRHFQVTRCNQCDEPPCVEACPVTSMFQRPDGIVDFDREVCIGCKACMAACPYEAIYINPDNHSAEKCIFCAQRVDQGLTPACVAVCPTQAIIIGDLRDPATAVSRILAREKVDVRRPEKGTQPKVFYKLGSEFTLRTLAAGGGSRQATVVWDRAYGHRVPPG
jgi:Fe-S-cluster-containing dehydrogenase component